MQKKMANPQINNDFYVDLRSDDSLRVSVHRFEFGDFLSELIFLICDYRL
jgi:hypothetical protein